MKQNRVPRIGMRVIKTAVAVVLSYLVFVPFGLLYREELGGVLGQAGPLYACIASIISSSGIITAVPTAWITRAPSRMPNVGANVASAVPTTKVLIAVSNETRGPNRSMNQPVSGIATAIVSMNAVVSHCALDSTTSNSCMRTAIAGVIVVSLRMTMNAAAVSTRTSSSACAGVRLWREDSRMVSRSRSTFVTESCGGFAAREPDSSYDGGVPGSELGSLCTEQG